MSIRIRKLEDQPNDRVDIHPRGLSFGKQDHIYYNITIPHRSSEQFTPAVYKKNNTVPILQIPHHYSLAITRFSISTGTVPILVAAPKDLINPTNTLIYSFGFEYNGNVEITNMIYDQPVNCERYFYYTYSRFLKSANEAIQFAFANIPGGTPPTAVAPILTFDATTKLFTITAQTAFYDEDLVTPIRFFMNSQVETLFPSWDTIPYIKCGGYNNNSELAFMVRFYNKGNNIVNNNFVNEQDYEMLTRWNSFKSIQITSNLPIQNEFIENDFNSIDAGKTTSQNILKDFIVLYAEGSRVARTTIDYTTNLLDYIDMKGVEPIRNIEINVFWVDNNGKQYPLYLGLNESVLIKLMFKNKEQFY